MRSVDRYRGLKPLHCYSYVKGLILHFYKDLTVFNCSHARVHHDRCAGVFSMILFNYTGKEPELKKKP